MARVASTNAEVEKCIVSFVRLFVPFEGVCLRTRITDRGQMVWKDRNAFEVIARKPGCREESEHDICCFGKSVREQSPKEIKSTLRTI